MPLEIIWTPLARHRLREIHDYIARDDLQAAERIATRIVSLVEALKIHPRLGRVGSRPGIRELVIGGTPYIVMYQERTTQVIIRSIWHGAQQRKL